MVDGFRYTSPWEAFERAVWELKELLKRKDAYWAVGFMANFGLFIDDAIARKMEKDILDIMYNEIIYLLRWRLDGGKIEKEDILEAASTADCEIQEEELETLVKIVCNKFELVMDAFDAEQLAIRYKLKRNTVSPKLSDLKYDVNTQYMPDGHKINCVLVNMACKKKWNGCAEQSDDITFICDEEDIDLWIGQLEEMRQRIRECQNGDDAE